MPPGAAPAGGSRKAVLQRRNPEETCWNSWPPLGSQQPSLVGMLGAEGGGPGGGEEGPAAIPRGLLGVCRSSVEHKLSKEWKDGEVTLLLCKSLSRQPGWMLGVSQKKGCSHLAFPFFLPGSSLNEKAVIVLSSATKETAMGGP